jgi:hypothetical protein
VSKVLAPGPVYHAGYVVTDLRTAIGNWVEQLGAGPFFLFEGFQFTDPVYRGRHIGPQVTLAFAFSGDFCVELIQQTDDTPSIYREASRALHHVGIVVPDLEAAVGDYVAKGIDCSFRGGFPFGGGCAYLETVASLGFMTELVQRTPTIDSMLAQMRAAHADWNRKDHVAVLG